jgi:acetyl-CoA carboxylase biotin carboxyl carrier protein
MDEQEEGRRSLLNPEILRELFQRLAATDVDELEVVHGTSRLYVRREPGKRSYVESFEGDGISVAAPGAPIAAPLTGVLYLRPAPDQAPYVSPGSLIEPGNVVALIETMKLFNEVIAEISGEVVTVAAQEGDLVEAGQVLMYVRAQAEAEDS